ncbi:C4-dicarboxylate TRAP transporter substrate-binding protein [Halomonas denitrificans]|uniref:C4-dicarboxylate TRAP transporter substrate-binding protein n=1 Tax=Halomonas TaxID=2745 RepID=UPI001C95D4B7|nr:MULTISPECIES: C4-dicarboxylate TRAP transporter substrate-binding protein [Halomonas]MBY6027855.1 C4-dicarboxylate TRAP transporter substrate-binding protein [Halomonas sp. DP8Y7-1]MCA0972979.1 C4-dicarboxylate TRAP transporter substrate-binding protein [Halomonas denitrificans]MED5297319.1 C4-dicarboxylate TRAP transporter substrate-binding protein [Pseudomonadota bacterium]
MLKKSVILAAAVLSSTQALAAYELNLSTAQSSQDPMVKAMENAAERIEQRSEGEVTLNIFSSSQLGADNDMIEQIRNGANIAVLTDAGRLSEFQPELGILAAPYLVDSHEDYDRITSSEPYLEWVELLAENTGMRLMNYNWFQGTRQMFTQMPIEGPEDLEGVRVRTINSPGWIKTIEGMGATPVPLPWSEIYSAIQLGTIDGAEAQLTGAHGLRLQEVTSNVTLTNHIHLMTGLLVSERWYQELPDELRTMLDEELKKAGDEATQMTVDAQADVRKEMEEAGVEFAEVDTERFSSQMQAVYDDMGWTDLREQLAPVLSAGE